MSASTPTQVNAPAALTPLRETWRQLMRSAEPHAAALRRSIWLLALAAALQGLALACMVPIFGALLPPAGSLADAASWHAGGAKRKIKTPLDRRRNIQAACPLG